LREEAFLRQHFGQTYADYATRVGPLWPRRLGRAPAATSRGERFAWRRVMAHREWKTWLGVAAVLIYLLVVVRAAPGRSGSGGHDLQPRAHGSG
jgi:protein-S-isoprenylcysteine O-methyltransferase Ste14